MKGIPSLRKFEYDEVTECYVKRMIHDEKVYRIIIPLQRWNAKSRQNIHYWLKINNDSINTTFPFGEINQEKDINVNDVLNHGCEYCGRKMKNLKNKRNHMNKCKHRPLETKDDDHSITHDPKDEITYVSESKISEKVETKPTTLAGIVYLVQPGKLKETNRYKFGCSRSTTFNRCNNYGLGTKVILVLKADDPHKAERFILRELYKKYKPYHGNEWFAGDEDVIYNDVLDAFNEYRKTI